MTRRRSFTLALIIASVASLTYASRNLTTLTVSRKSAAQEGGQAISTFHARPSGEISANDTAARLVNLRKITASDGYHSARWSPHGDALSFVDDHATYVASASSFELRQVSVVPAGFAYFWTRDASSLVFRITTAGTFHIQKLWMSSGEVEELAAGEDLTLPSETEPGIIEYRVPVSVSKINRRSANVGPTLRPAIFAWQRDDQIFVSQLDAIRQVTTTGAGRYFLPTVSPNGKSLLYYELSQGLFITNLTTDVTRGVGVVSDASWSSQGDRLICVSISYENDQPVSSKLLIVSNDGSVLPVTEVSGLLPRRPTWSPDGRTIAFDADGAIYVAEIRE